MSDFEKTNEGEAESLRSVLLVSLPSFGVVLCFSISGILIRFGLAHLDAPLVGVTWGIFLVLIAYGALLWWRGVTADMLADLRQNLVLQILAGVFIGVGTWARYIAIGLIEVGVVVAVSRLSIPVVLIVAPLLVGRQLENVTLRVWFGAALIIVGSLVLTFA